MDQEIFTKAALFQTENSNFLKFTSKMHAEHTEVLQLITIGIIYKSDIDIKNILLKEISSPKSLKKGSTTLYIAKLAISSTSATFLPIFNFMNYLTRCLDNDLFGLLPRGKS
jgi:hypothetical protein